METKEINDKNILKNLNSDNKEFIISAIEDVRNQGNIELLHAMLEVLITNNDSEIEKCILNCIADLKNKNVVPFLISTISNKKFELKKRELLHALWQTNFDFSPFVDLFVDFLIQDSFEISFEALTLIEIIAETLDENKKIELSVKIKDSILLYSSPKKELLEEALKIVGGC